MHQKLVPDSFLILLYKLKQPLHARNYFKNKIFWKRIIKKTLKELFLSNSVIFNGQSYRKQKGSGTSDQALFTEQVQKKSFIRYILSDQVWWCNVKQFLSYPKNYICIFMKVNSRHHKLFHFHLFFWTGKCGKEGQLEYLEN